MSVKNKVQLITYPDSLGGNLKNLAFILDNYFADIFQGGIHILPPYPSSGDRGFAPITYFEIDKQFGDWQDIEKLSSKYDIMLDLMVNHISYRSIYVQDFLQYGLKSQFADLFLPLNKIWEDGIPLQDDIDKIFLRREKPFSEYILKNGEKINLWTSFGKSEPSEQVDIDVNSPLAQKLFEDIFSNLAYHGVKNIRLDAIGYVIKKMGTSSFFVEPEIYNFLNWIKELAEKFKMNFLPEIHSIYSIQYKLAEKGYWIYDFILPYMILNSYIKKDGKELFEYIKNRPNNQFTMLDCHDGIPVKPDLDELAVISEAQHLVDYCVLNGANLSRILSEKYKSLDGFDVHQIRCTYFSAMDENPAAYLTARAMQFFTPGIPQVYYVGFLAGVNDGENIAKTGDGREINRHNYSLDEIDKLAQSSIVQKMMKLIKFRNEYCAFDGHFSVSLKSESMYMTWKNHEKFECTLSVNFQTFSSEITYFDSDINNKKLDI